MHALINHTFLMFLQYLKICFVYVLMYMYMYICRCWQWKTLRIVYVVQ